MAGEDVLVESILHPTDFSEASMRAFAHALALAVLRKTELTIVHAGPEREADVEWSRFPPVREMLHRWGLLDADSRRSDIREKLHVSVEKMAVRSRYPALAMSRLLELAPRDLIVLATEGRQGPARWLRRSRAEGVARWSRTMTLFVPADARRTIVSPEDGALTLSNIVLPVDETPDPTAAVEFACRAARLLGGDHPVTITLLHVGTAAPSLALPEGETWRWNREQSDGEVVDQILATAERHHAELIVMATAGHDSVLDVLRGSITEQVLRSAPCPLLAVPQRRRRTD